MLTMGDRDKTEDLDVQRILTDAACLSAAQISKKGCRWGCQKLGLSRMNTVYMLKLDLKLFPYHIHVKQKLTEQDQYARAEMCSWFDDKMEEDKDWIDDVWFNDEAHFHFDGHINSKNCVFWRSKPTQTFCSSLRKGYSLMCNKFRNHSGTLLVTVTQENYCTIICKFYGSVSCCQRVVIIRQ